PPHPPTSTLFPYTTLFRSQQIGARLACEAVRGHGNLQAYRVNGRPLTRAAMVRSPTRTDTAVSGLACWRLTNASAIGRPRPNERTALVTRPTAPPSATTSAPG